MLNCIATKPDARKILFQLWKGGEVGMTVKEAVKHLENLKWLKGYSNTTVDGVPIGNVIDGIIALLKEQEPRVMTLEELVVDDVVWLEDCDKETTVPGIYCDRNDTNTIFATRMRGYLFVMNDEYGKRWRCWTSRPTDEQREKVKWE